VVIDWVANIAATIAAAANANARGPGAIAHEHGKVVDALAGAKTKLEAEYEVPYLAHAPMEPLNCAVKSPRTSIACRSASMRTGCPPRGTTSSSGNRSSVTRRSPRSP
jgi:CO/xanthine dehydrogenase Mo-binding subunit